MGRLAAACLGGPECGSRLLRDRLRLESSPGPIRFAKGSFLLDWHGRGGAVFFDEINGLDPWNANYTADIGDPVGAKTQIQTGVWQRQYSAGIVVVNATTATVTVTVAGNTRTIAADRRTDLRKLRSPQRVEGTSREAACPTTAKPGDCYEDGHRTGDPRRKKRLA